jgi:uncharacterized membrane protein YdbT with pleckstrin-like domain
LNKTSTETPVWLKQFLWLLLIWLLSVGVLALAALLMRWLMSAAGMTA